MLLDDSSTFSKRPQSYVEGVYCPRVSHGTGNHLVMADGSIHFDLVSGLGSNLWECSNNYSLECQEIDEASELFLDRIPYHSYIKFMKNGGDACHAAVRYMRAYTGKSHIRYTGYHGCTSGFVACTPPAAGCIDEDYHKYDSLEALTDAIEPTDAGVIVEPLELDLENLTERLQALRDRCTLFDIPLCFDEIITGWRVKKFSVANMTGVYPDLSCFGKALAGGYPMGILAVTDTVADKCDGVFISTTFGGEQEGLRQLIHTIKRTEEVDINRMWDLSATFQEQVNALNPNNLSLQGYPARYVWECDEVYKAMIWQELYERRILAGAAFFPKLSWRASEYSMIYNTIGDIVSDIRDGKVTLTGRPPQPIFKRT